MTNLDIRDLIARSSLGGTGWCTHCDHPDALHTSDNLPPFLGRCHQPGCYCKGFEPQSAEEWVQRHGVKR